ncbi:hypothetical protein GAYE_PCTG50G1191 [Galdieria yellowstonensis]|uniref:Uncharacterized protein n=1 Tax=Galdieria yellowstonensis TaxID=3028027 RepID=A0AAV9I581_9RHOD|nr:hypothetical protein GAYE_PCTG50G1191 [Galdieria yellowstonensis]
MFSCCLPVFLSPSSTKKLDSAAKKRSRTRTNVDSERLSLPTLVDETMDADESFHIVTSEFSEDGTHTAIVTPRKKISSRDIDARVGRRRNETVSFDDTVPSHALQQEEKETVEYQGDEEWDALRRICSEPIGNTNQESSFLNRYRKWNERHSLRLAVDSDDEEQAALRRMKGSVLRAHSSMTFHF